MMCLDKANEKAIRIENYLHVLEILCQSTDDYLFLWDIEKDENWFFGNVSRDYAWNDKDETANAIMDMEKIIYPADRAMVHDDLMQIANGEKQVHNLNYRWVNRQEEVVWISCRGKVIPDEAGKPFVMIGRVSDTALKYLYNPLTRLFNKTKLLSDIKDDTFLNDGGYFMLVDVDNLGDINFKYGRKYGDEILKDLAKALEEVLPSQKIYHIEHNCFALCLDMQTDCEVGIVYGRLQQAMAEKCTLSAGVVPNNNVMFKEKNYLYDCAEQTLKKAKANGKNTIAFFSEDDMAQKISAMELLAEMQESIKRNCEGFYLCYQPQVKAGNYRLYAAEALLRYTSEKRGRVFPDEFIPLLEDSKLIMPVGRWVLETALQQCKEWRKTYPNLRMSVNFSTVQLKEKNIARKVLEILDRVGLPGTALTIEITESIQMHEIQYFNNIFRPWREEGIEISIDDFGTGYANLSYLKDLEVNEIKIDRIFVKGIKEATYNYKLVNNMIDFAKMNSLRICCEGVEDMHELAVLEGMSPNLLQGYLFDKPCESEQFERFYIDKDSEEYKKHLEFIGKLYQYKEKMRVIYFDPKDILRNTDVGLWIIRIDQENAYYEMHADETMERVMGVDKKYTPEECYAFWYERIKPEYVDYVNRNVERMLHTDKVVQLQYPWIHPVLGEVLVRCSGKQMEDSDGMFTLEGYHRIVSDIEEA